MFQILFMILAMIGTAFGAEVGVEDGKAFFPYDKELADVEAYNAQSSTDTKTVTLEEPTNFERGMVNAFSPKTADEARRVMTKEFVLEEIIKAMQEKLVLEAVVNETKLDLSLEISNAQNRLNNLMMLYVDAK